jgi:hypothetical protein
MAVVGASGCPSQAVLAVAYRGNPLLDRPVKAGPCADGRGPSRSEAESYAQGAALQRMGRSALMWLHLCSRGCIFVEMIS